MMKDVKREFLRQIQETMQFKFNLFLLGILLAIVLHIQHFL